MNNSIEVHAIGIGLDNKKELEMLASSPDNIGTLSGYSDIRYLAEDLKNKVMACK